MSEPSSRPGPLRGTLGLVVVGTLAFGLATLLMVTSGALQSGFGAFEDEPSHFLGGLMVHDYLRDSLGTHPLRYAEDYYVHYPKVAIGQWPPVWPALQGLWMLVFGVSTLSVQLLLCALMAAVGTLVFAAVREEAGVALAGTAALLLPCMPLVQRFGHMSMTEVPQTLFTIAAVLAFGCFVDTGRGRWSLAFALLAVAAILTKGNGIFLALVPPLTIALTGRWSLVKRPALWGSAALVAALCAPWYLLTLGISRSTWGAGTAPTLEYAVRALPTYAVAMLYLGGIAMALVAVLGFVTRLRESPHPGRWAALAAWIPALLAGVLAVPTGIDARHLVLAAPAWLAGWAAGAAWLARRAPSQGGVPVVPLLLVGAFFVEVFERPRKRTSGYRTAARVLLADPTLERSRLLVASDSRGEGLFVAAVAMDEERPGHVVLRASKVLSRSDWMGRDYELLYGTPESLAEFLERLPVGVVALDRSVGRDRWLAHHELLEGVIEGRPEVWQPIGTYDVVRDGVLHAGALALYRQVGHEDRIPLPLDLDRVGGRRLPGF